MTHYTEKFWHIVPAYIATMLGALALTLAPRWLLTVETGIFTPPAMLWSVVVPFVAAPLAWFVALRRRVGITDAKEGGGFFSGGFLRWSAGGCLLAVLLAGQQWVANMAGDEVAVSSIGALDVDRHTRNVRLEQGFALDFDRLSAVPDVRPGGKYNDYLDVALYLMAPFAEQPANGDRYWFTKVYFDEIDRDLSDAEQSRQYRQFLKRSGDDFRKHWRDTPDHFRILAGGRSDNAKAGIAAQWLGIDPERVVIFIPRFSPVVESAHAVMALFFVLGVLLVSLALMFAGFNAPRYQAQKAGRSPTWQPLWPCVRATLPAGPHAMAKLLIWINAAVFVVMVMNGVNVMHPNGKELLPWGASFGPAVMHGEGWRLITAMFVHGGLRHLFGNMVVLLGAAWFLEPKVGRARFLLIYLLAGIGGSLASLLWHADVIGAGASGAIFGLLGAIAARALLRADGKHNAKTVLMIVAAGLGLSLLWRLLMPVDIAAHAGGFLTGALVAGVLRRTRTG